MIPRSAARGKPYASVVAILRCPSCSRKLKERCYSCSKPVDPAWKVCPFCEAELQSEPPPQATRRRRGRTSTTDQPTVAAEVATDGERESRRRG